MRDIIKHKTVALFCHQLLVSQLQLENAAIYEAYKYVLWMVTALLALSHYNDQICTVPPELLSYKIYKTHVMWHSPNVTLGSVPAVQKRDFGISPNVMYKL